MSENGTNPQVEAALSRGRNRVWWPWLIALAIPVFTILFYLPSYPALPERIPTHWNGAGQPNDWSDKSFWSAFQGQFINFAVLAFTGFIAYLVPQLMNSSESTTTFARFQREGSRRSMVAGLGGLAIVLSALMFFVTFSIFQTDYAMPAVVIVILALLCIPAMIPGFLYGARWSRRAIQEAGVIPSSAELEEESKWLPGGIRNDPSDPSAFVPKRDGYGMGLTVNWGSKAGKAWTIGFFVVLALFILLMTVISANS